MMLPLYLLCAAKHSQTPILSQTENVRLEAYVGNPEVRVHAEVRLPSSLGL